LDSSHQVRKMLTVNHSHYLQSGHPRWARTPKWGSIYRIPRRIIFSHATSSDREYIDCANCRFMDA
jgi:hypothetical protein